MEKFKSFAIFLAIFFLLIPQFSSARVDNEGGIAKNTCNLKIISNNHFEGKSSSEYSQGGITFSWGFDIELKR